MNGLFGQLEAPIPVPARDERVPMNVWPVQQARSREQRSGRYAEDVFHSQKMVPELARRMLAHMRLPAGSVVLDPWAGIGTTVVEAHEMGLRVVGCDIAESYIEKGVRANLALAIARTGVSIEHDVRVGDCRQMTWMEDQSADGCVGSPPYGDCDPSRDSNGRTIKQRAADGEAYAGFALRTSAYRFDASALAVPGAMGAMTLGEWEASMFLSCREIRRVLKHGAHCLLAVREFWRRRSQMDLVDLPGITLQIGRSAGLKPVDIIYAMDCALADDLELKSRGSLHQNRLARLMQDGRPCPRGVPGVTRVLVFERRVRKKPRRAPAPEAQS